jgi:hypothetical protein
MIVNELEKLKFNDIDEGIVEKLPNFEDGSELAEMLKCSNKLGWNDAIDTIINNSQSDIKEILDIVHKTIYQFFDICGDDEEVPMSDKDKLLLKVNKAICNNLKEMYDDRE